MPLASNLTGQRFGKLLVLGRAEDILSESGKTTYSAWLCKCDCGRQEVIRANRLPTCDSRRARRDVATACAHCNHQRLCKVCSRTFESARYRATCSEECAIAHKRALDMDAYHRKVARDPELNRRRYRSAKEADPERLRSAWQAAGVQRTQRLAADPTYREHVNARAREAYAARAEEIQARRRERRTQRLLEMTPAEQEEYRARQRAASTAAGRRYRSTPEGAAANRRNVQNSLARKKMAELLQLGTELSKRSEKNDGSD